MIYLSLQNQLDISRINLEQISQSLFETLQPGSIIQKFLDPIPFKRTELEVRFCSNFRFSLAGVFAHCDSWDDGQLGKKDHLSIGCSGHQSSLISKQVDGGNAVGRRPRAPHHHRDHERASRRHAARVVLLRLRRNEKLQEREKRPP